MQHAGIELGLIVVPGSHPDQLFIGFGRRHAAAHVAVPASEKATGKPANNTRHTEINMNNAMTTFGLTADGAKTHFYFWKFDTQPDGHAKVQLRLEWPVEDPTLELTVLKTGQTVTSLRR